MSNLSIPVIRHSLRTWAPSTRLQRRWARVHDVRFVTTHRDSEKILNRYKDKLEQKAKEEGHESVSSLKEAYKEKIDDIRRSNPVLPNDVSNVSKKTSFQEPPPPPPIPAKESKYTKPSSTTKSSSGAPGVRPLSSYLDLEKISTLPNKEIEYIWRLRHANDPLSLCAVIPLETYNRLYRTAKVYPQFILPLPRPVDEDGNNLEVEQSADAAETAAEIHFLQWGFYPPASNMPATQSATANTHTSTVLFTHLAAFKLHGTYAQPHTTVTHHLDLADSHKLVLLNGTVTEGRGVNVDEARWLLMCLQKFYDYEVQGGGMRKERKQDLLEKFRNGDQTFRIEDLIDEAERIS